MLFTVPSRYSCTIGEPAYLALGGGPPGFAQGFSCPALLGWRLQPGMDNVAYGALTRSGAAFQRTSAIAILPPRVRHDPPRRSHDPHRTTAGALTCGRFSLSPVRSPLLRASLLLSSRPGNEMFQFPGCPPPGYLFTMAVSPHHGRRVAPFGDHRLHVCVRLPGAFRGSPRPSSALVPRASTVCRLFLDRRPVRPPALN